MEINNEGSIEIKQIIGKGNFGKVLLGIVKKTGEKIAIKIIDKVKMNKCCSSNQLKRELNAMTQMDNLNVIKIYKIDDKENEYKIYMEYCEKGELYDHIVKNKYLEEEEASYYYYQLINGLEYIHSKNIVHRDLKPENLLITKDYILKIIDFGLSNYHDIDNLLNTPCGSPSYASPEMVSGKQYNGTLVDIWCTGIILFAMLSGYLPFEANDNYSLFKKIIECKIDYPIDISKSAIDLMKKILINDPSKRITIQGIKKHPFYLEGQKIFESVHKKKIKKNSNSNETEKNVVQKRESDLKNLYDRRSEKKKGTKKKKYYVKKKIVEQVKENIENTDNKDYKKTPKKNIIEDENKKLKKSVGNNNNIKNSNIKNIYEESKNKTFKKKAIFKRKNILNLLNTYNKNDDNNTNMCHTENNNDIIKYVRPLISPLSTTRKRLFEEQFDYNSKNNNSLKYYERRIDKLNSENKNYSPQQNIFGPYKRPTLYERNFSVKRVNPNTSRRNYYSLHKTMNLNDLNLYNSLALTERKIVYNNKFNDIIKVGNKNNTINNDSYIYRRKAANSSSLKEDKYIYEKKHHISKPKPFEKIYDIPTINNSSNLNNFFTINSAQTTRSNNLTNLKDLNDILLLPDIHRRINENRQRNLYINIKNFDSIKNVNNNYKTNIFIEENDMAHFDNNRKTLDVNGNNYIKKQILNLDKLRPYNIRENQAKTISKDEKRVNSRLLNQPDQIFIKKKISKGNMTTRNHTINEANSYLNPNLNTIKNKKIDISHLIHSKNNTVIFNNQINQLNIYNNDNFHSINFHDNIKKNKIKKLKIKTPYKFKNDFNTLLINNNSSEIENSEFQSLNTDRKIIKKKIFKPKNKITTKNLSIMNNKLKIKKENLEIMDKYKGYKNNKYVSTTNKDKDKYAPFFTK